MARQVLQRCDNAGEHQEQLQKICTQLAATLEYVAPNTPQHNGVVERRFVTDRDRAMAMMLAANLNTETQSLLRCEALSTASKIGDLFIHQGQTKSAHELFYGSPSPLLPHLIEFGRIGYVTDRTPIKSKWQDKSFKCIMVGYADQHSPDTYQMYNPTTKSVILSRDIRWAEWTRIDPTNSLSQYLDQRPGIDTTPLPPPEPIPTIPTDLEDTSLPSIGEEEDSPIILTKFGATTIEDSEDSGEEEVNPIRLEVEQRQEPPPPMTRAQLKSKLHKRMENKRYPIRSHFKAQAGDKVQELESAPAESNISWCNSAIVSDPGEPKDWRQALNKGWHEAMASEVMNFVNRKAWKKVERKIAAKLGRIPIGTKWVFKIKNLHDGSVKKKARCVVQGFKQIPGVDYTESFSPVATDTAIRILIVIFFISRTPLDP